ncbi:MAG: FtsX-like permease family protein [Muribaculaceae bacterium]|nr:FtsX-like permease family protein [Muribaculaceae bacterium]
MFRLIFKNLWNLRRRYMWLFIELIIITCISWYIVDAAAVSIADSNAPTGYDPDRLALLDVGILHDQAPRYRKDRADSLSQEQDFNTLAGKMRRLDGVERVSVISNMYINGWGYSRTNYKTGNPADTLVKSVYQMSFYPGQEFFETYGIRSVPGSPTVEELSARSYGPYDIVITKDYADRFWPDGDAVGKRFIRPMNEDDTLYFNVVGVTEGVRYVSHVRSNDLVFRPSEFRSEGGLLLVRLAPGTDMKQWIDNLAHKEASGLVTGNYFISQAQAYDDIISLAEYRNGVTADRSMMIVLLVFFLFNLTLGVIGSFFLQTRRRVTEMGVHRSFGAKRCNVVSLLMGEGAALATIAGVTGCLIYLQLATRFGFNEGGDDNGNVNLIDNWVTDPVSHFFIISGIVIALILVCTLIGTFFPALKVSRVEPVDALRDE